MAKIEVLEVLRPKPEKNAVRVNMRIGDILIDFILLNGEPFEIYRSRYVSVLEKDTLSIHDTDYEEMKSMVRAILSESREAKPKKKLVAARS